MERRRMQVQEGNGEREGDDNATTATNDEGNGEKGADGDQDGEMAAERDGDDNATTATNDEGSGKKGADGDQDGEMAAATRPDNQARRRKAPGVIVSDTGANRPQRTREHDDIYQDTYQAGIKRTVKKPGRGRGRQ